MAVIKCKMCGGTLNVTEGLTVAECEYCGSRQTIPTADNEKKMTLFTRAARLLRGCEFDKAAGVFEAIVADFPEEAEAYWGLVLCKYGIEYVDDPATGKKIPTCHRSGFDSVLDDENFEQACENTDALARRVYRDEARQMEELRKAIIEVSGKEEPYDIFISYKETDAEGQRTLDSVLAQDIYTELTEKGYRVFFSRISLEDKLGTEYEPYIFAALNSAKLMLVVGTDYEHFDAVWVKNEWSRFLKLMAAGQKKVLIPVFKNIGAYDMPKEFAKLAAQDMGKIGAMQDLLRGVEKILGKRGETAAAKPAIEGKVTEQVIIRESGSGPNVTAMIDRGCMALEDRKWKEAEDFFNRALDMDAKCTQAYLGLFLVEQQAISLKDYARKIQVSLEESEKDSLIACEEEKKRIQNAVTKYVVSGYLNADTIRKLFRFDRNYRSASNYYKSKKIQILNELNQNKNIQRAEQYGGDPIKVLSQRLQAEIVVFMDEKIENAYKEDKQRIDEVKNAYARHLENAEAEASRLHDLARFKQKNDTTKKRLAVFSATAIFLISLMIIYVIVPAVRYYRAENLLKNREYDEAVIAFTALGKYKDAKERILEVYYVQAEALLAEGNKSGAAEYFIKAGDYMDAAERSMEAYYADAEDYLQSGDYEAATESFAALGNYMDATERVPSFFYTQAEALLATGNKAEAAMNFAKAGEYKDAAQRAEALWKTIAVRNSIAACYHTVGLRSDGTAITVGEGGPKQNISNWTKLISVDASAYSTVGLRSDGTVLAVGSNANGECNVSDWTDIVAIAAGDYHTVGLRADGTVVATKYTGESLSYSEQCEVSDWTDIVAIAAGDSHTVGLRADGTVVAVGSNANGECNVSEWRDIVAIAAGDSHTVGLRADGTVISVGSNHRGQCNVSNWTDIVAIAAKNDHTVGLRSDGTVVAVGWNFWGVCDVSGMTGIVAIATGGGHTVGLRSDGTVVATKHTGIPGRGQGDMSDWTDIRMPGL